MAPLFLTVGRHGFDLLNVARWEVKPDYVYLQFRDSTSILLERPSPSVDDLAEMLLDAPAIGCLISRRHGLIGKTPDFAVDIVSHMADFRVAREALDAAPDRDEL